MPWGVHGVDYDYDDDEAEEDNDDDNDDVYVLYAGMLFHVCR